MKTIPIDLSIEFMKGNVARLSEKEAKTQDKIYKKINLSIEIESILLQ